MRAIPKETFLWSNYRMNDRFQIRIRTEQEFSEINYVTQWLNEAREGFAFCHNKPGNHHYHIYLFGLKRDAGSMRKTLYRYLKDKSKYSVSQTCKTGPITSMLAYQYGTESTLTPPVWFKGFTQEQLSGHKLAAAEYYESLKKDTQGVVSVTREEHYIIRPDRVWERLLDNRDKYRDMTVKMIKSTISAEWLNNGKAIPRPSDLHRYAISLYMLNKYDGIIPDDAILKYDNEVA